MSVVAVAEFVVTAARLDEYPAFPFEPRDDLPAVALQCGLLGHWSGSKGTMHQSVCSTIHTVYASRSLRSIDRTTVAVLGADASPRVAEVARGVDRRRAGRRQHPRL